MLEFIDGAEGGTCKNINDIKHVVGRNYRTFTREAVGDLLGGFFELVLSLEEASPFDYQSITGDLTEIDF